MSEKEAAKTFLGWKQPTDFPINQKKNPTQFPSNQDKSSQFPLRLEIQQRLPSLKRINAHKCVQNCAPKGTKHKAICNTLNPECIFTVKLFNQSLVQEQYVPLSFRYMQNTRKKKSDGEACRTRQPCSCLVSRRGREERESGRERRGVQDPHGGVPANCIPEK